MNDKAKFDIKDLLPIAMTLIVFGIGIAYMLNVQEDVRDDFGTEACSANTNSYTTYNATVEQCQNASGNLQNVPTNSFNSSGDAINASAKLPAKLPLIATVVVAVIIIGLIIRFLVVRMG